MHVFGVPVVGVLNVNMYLLRGEFVHQICAAVPHARVVYAKIGAVFLYAGRAHRIVAAKLKQAQEIYTRLGKGILQCVFVYCLHAYRIRAHGFRRGLALNDGGGIIVILLRAGYIALHHVGIAGIVRRVQHPLRSCYPVLRGNFALFRAGIVIPFHAFAYFQRPGQSVVAYLPVCCRSGLQIAIAVARNQRFNAVRAEYHVYFGRAVKVIQGGDFAVVKHAVCLFRAAGPAVRPGGAAVIAGGWIVAVCGAGAAGGHAKYHYQRAQQCQ